MSQGEPMPLDIARDAAEAVQAFLSPGCDRIEIAGSIRRRKAEVRDIELVAVPRIAHRPIGLLEEETEAHNALEELVAQYLANTDGALRARDVENHRADGSIEIQHKLGPAFKALTCDGIPVDLFITDAERWGCIFALRTGPGDWNIRLVEECKQIFRQVQGGRVLHLGKPVATPEEADFFRALGQPWVDPWDRSPDRVSINWSVAG